MSSLADANPSDENVEKSLKEERDYLNKRKYSIVPRFLENDGLDEKKEVRREAEKRESRAIASEDYEDLSSDKENDTTEGEITDTHTAD